MKGQVQLVQQVGVLGRAAPESRIGLANMDAMRGVSSAWGVCPGGGYPSDLVRWGLVSDRQVIIDTRFCGPSDSANGGYVCGVLAEILGGTAEVTLRRPPPIDPPLTAREVPEGGVGLFDGAGLVARGLAAAPPEIRPPAAVSQEEAIAAAERYPGFTGHPFPTCFVCGPERDEDGLRIFPGSVSGRDLVAAPWQPDPTLADEDGLVRPRFQWAALDCSGAFASGFPTISMVLGRLTATLLEPVRPGQDCVVLGWSEGSEGRKHFAGTALLDGDGALLALARATWISLPPAGS